MTKAAPKARLIDIQKACIPRTAQGVPVRPRQNWNVQSDVARELRRKEEAELRNMEARRYDPSITPTLSDRLYGFCDEEPNEFKQNDPVFGRMRTRHLKESEAASTYRDMLNAGGNPRQENPTGIEFNNFLDTLPQGNKDQQRRVNDLSAMGHSYLSDAPIHNALPPAQHHAPAWYPTMPPISTPLFANAPAYASRLSTTRPYPSYGYGMGPAHTLANTSAGMPFPGFDPHLVIQAQQVWNNAAPEEVHRFLHEYYGGQPLQRRAMSAPAPMMETSPSPASYHSMPYQTTSPPCWYSSPTIPIWNTRAQNPPSSIPTWHTHAQHSHPPPMPSPMPSTRSLPCGLSEYNYGIQRSVCDSARSSASSPRYRTVAIPRSRRYHSSPPKSSRRGATVAQEQDGLYEDDVESSLPSKRMRCR